MNKKTLFAIVACLLLSAMGYSQDVKYVLTDGISDGRLKTEIELNISRLLTAINNACDRGSREINYSGIDITDKATDAIGTYWKQFHFKTEKKRYASFCVKLSGSITIFHQGNIGVMVIPVAENKYSGPERREVSIYLDERGKIVDFAFAKEKFEYEQVIKKGEKLNDLDKRMQIIEWCQYLQQAYCDKDIKFIDDVFSEDALILVGKLTTTRKRINDRVVLKTESTYKQLSKKEYIDGLRTAFNKNGYVNVKFDDFEVKRHFENPNFYAVSLKQVWRSSTYSDEGILFLIWDFTDEDNPKIHVRVWQHPSQKRFKVGDFNIPDK